MSVQCLIQSVKFLFFSFLQLISSQVNHQNVKLKSTIVNSVYLFNYKDVIVFIYLFIVGKMMKCE